MVTSRRHTHSVRSDGCSPVHNSGLARSGTRVIEISNRQTYSSTEKIPIFIFAFLLSFGHVVRFRVRFSKGSQRKRCTYASDHRPSPVHRGVPKAPKASSRFGHAIATTVGSGPPLSKRFPCPPKRCCTICIV